MITKQYFLNISPFNFHVELDSEVAIENFTRIYAGHFEEYTDQIIDYSVKVKLASGVRKYFKPQAHFYCDEREPFRPLPLNHAYAFLEWGMNWAIANHEMQQVIIHSAVLAKGDKAILFPAPPGSGKSTLTSYLAFSGWRLLSDEMALIIPNSNRVVPFVRPICLKANSIELVKTWFPDGKFSTIAENTHKGDVIHLSPPQNSWDRKHDEAEIVGIVFPRYNKDVDLDVYQLSQVQGFMQFAENAFNYGVVGEKGFNTLTKLTEASKLFEVHYNDLEKVREFLEQEVLN